MNDDDNDIHWLLLAITLLAIAMIVIVIAIADHIWRLIAAT